MKGFTRFPHRLLVYWSEINHQANRSSCLSGCFQSVRSHTVQSEPAHIQCALHDPECFSITAFFLNFEESFVPPLKRANISAWLAIPLAAVQQNTAYIIMQIYLFIVCNHATEPNMPFFTQKGGEGGGRREGKEVKKVTAVAVMRSRRGCCWECHTAFGHTSRAWPRGSLSPFSSTGLEGWVVSAHHGHAFFTSLLHKCTKGKRTSRKQSEVVNSSQVPQEDMDWGHKP